MGSEWYCQVQGTEYGPLTPRELKRMAETGKLGPSDLVRDGPEGKWLRAGSVKGLTWRSPEVPATSAEDPNTCWYCKKHPADPHAAYTCRMHKTVKTQGVPFIWLKFTYQALEINVPRCPACKQLHRRQITACVLLVVAAYLVLLIWPLAP